MEHMPTAQEMWNRTRQPLGLADDYARRARVNPNEHPLIGRLVVLRVAMNHAFGASEFREFDHELAQLETALTDALASAHTGTSPSP